MSEERRRSVGSLLDAVAMDLCAAPNDEIMRDAATEGVDAEVELAKFRGLLDQLEATSGHTIAAARAEYKRALLKPRLNAFVSGAGQLPAAVRESVSAFLQNAGRQAALTQAFRDGSE